MNDLLCAVPLYGKDCERVSLRMLSSLAVQRTRYDVKYLFLYDSTVSNDAVLNVHFLMKNHNYDTIYCENSHSGYKRNLAIKYAVENNFKYLWLLDQDDWLMQDMIFDVILSYCIPRNESVLKIKYQIPDHIDAANAKGLYNTITMPWQYVIRTDLIKDYRFNEVEEYGSDVPYVIRFLAVNGYVEVLQNSSLRVKKDIASTLQVVYYYNYLNPMSHMGKHITMDNIKKQKEINYAVSELEKIRLECKALNK